MRTKLLSATGVVAAFCLSAGAQAAVIETNAGVFDAAITAYQPFGQTFTAIDTNLLSLGFAYSNINPASANNPITLSLFAGEGVGGPLLASRIFTLPGALPSTSDAPVIIDTDFSGVGLTVGSLYTAALTAGGSFKVAVVYGGDTYAGGHALGGLSGCPACDLNFRVVGESPVSAIPEPSTWALALAGFGLLGGALRHRRSMAMSRLA